VLQAVAVADHMQRPLVLLAPILPAATGNGLAMRAGAQLQALSARYDGRLVVVPVAGGSADTRWAGQFATTTRVVAPGDAADRRAAAAVLVGSAMWRDRLGRAEPLPHAVTYASPALAARVAVAAGGPGGARVHALRAYLAPLAVAVAEQLGASPTTLDLDDDDEHALSLEGRADEAAAYGRVIATFGPELAWLSLAAPEDARRVADRHGLRTAVVPNSVAVSPEIVGRTRAATGQVRLLFVGNLSYGPNAEAAELLVMRVLPRARRLVDARVTVELVGSFEPGSPVAELAGRDGVELRGHVDDLDDAYARASIAVLALEQGSGTRIKLLEALAAGVPVVTTAVGASGIDVEDGRHVLIAEGADAQARAVARIACDEPLAAALVRAGRALVSDRYEREAVGRQLVRLMEEVSDDEVDRSEL
jgi:polysaccharide biosynthesis protein PslH